MNWKVRKSWEWMMDNNDYVALSSYLHNLTPTLIADTMAYMQEDAVISIRYGTSIRELAEQAVVSFREVLLGAVQFDLPQVVEGELDWTQGLLGSRQLDAPKLMQNFLHLHRRHLSEKLPENLATPVLAIIDTALAKVNQANEK